MESSAPAAAPVAPAPVPAADDEGDVCGICLDELDDDGERGRPEGCDGHFFHADRESTTDKRSDNIPQWVGGPGGRVSKIQSVLKGYL